MTDVTGAISADSHVVEPREAFDGLVERFGDRAPRIERVPGLGDAMVIPAVGARHAVPVMRLALAGARDPDGGECEEAATSPRVQALVAQGYEGMRAGVLDPRRRVEDQDLDGIRAEVLYPSLFLSLFGLSDQELVAACFRRYNEVVRDYAAAAPTRLIALALIPTGDAGRARAEVEWALANGFRGGCIACRSTEGHSYRDDSWEPLWAAAAEARFPLSLHLGANGWRSARTTSPGPADPILGYASTYVTVQETLADLVLGGVLHRFPALRIVCTEFGAGWMGNWAERLDRGFARSRRFASPELDRLPSEYLRRQVYVTFETDRSAVATRSLVGVDRLMWASDYPHRDATWPRSSAVLEELFCGVDERDRQAMTRENVAALYGL